MMIDCSAKATSKIHIANLDLLIFLFFKCMANHSLSHWCAVRSYKDAPQNFCWKGLSFISNYDCMYYCNKY